MKRKRSVIAVCLTVFMCLLMFPAGIYADTDAPPWSGSGTESDPYLIESVTDLSELADNVNGGEEYSGIYFKLTEDISITDSWTPIGSSTSATFNGNFDGNGKTVTFSDITTDASSFALFGYISGARISDITVSGKIAIKNSDAVATIAGIVGGASDGSVITGCVNEADIDSSGTDGAASGASCAGICISITQSVITNCVNYGTLTTNTANSAGICLTINCEGSVKDCGNYGDVSGYGAAGIVKQALPLTSEKYGYSGEVKISGCFNKGSIRSSGVHESMTAGILAYAGSGGKNGGSINVSDCYNTGTISGTSTATKRGGEPHVAGITAWADVMSDSNVDAGNTINISNCYNTGTLVKNFEVNTDEKNKTARYGEIIPSKYIDGSDYAGWTEKDINTENVIVSNCYASAEISEMTPSAAAAALGGSYKEDTNGVNKGNTPLLTWESGEKDDTAYTVTFSVTGPEKSDVQVFEEDDGSTPLSANDDGTYSLKPGTYNYIVTADGYVTVRGSFRVVNSDVTQEIKMEPAYTVTFTVTPADASFSLTSGSSELVPDSSENGVYTYHVADGATCSYTAEADGYNGVTRQITVSGDQNISVALTASAVDPSAGEDRYVYGSCNAGKTNTITKGGTYYVGKGAGESGAQGTITINTTEPVTLVGTGISSSDSYSSLFIDCVQAGSDLTLQDIYIRDYAEKTGNLINFTGKGNKLSWKGTSILDFDQNAAGYAMIHVNKDTELTMGGVSDSDTLYMYKREQGAGIGGNSTITAGSTPETNGKITYTGGILFGKNSKQGAFFGAGAGTGSTQDPGDIIFEGGTVNLIAISRGSAIGGSAGSSGASSGSNVYISNTSLNINIDYSGAAIGGGGFAEGNDSDGGTLHYISGSIRTYIDSNAVDPDGDGSASDTLWTGITSQGSNNNAAITADVVDSDGSPAYLLEFDTSQLGASAGTYTVKDGNDVVYSGGLHKYRYVNESLNKLDQIPISYTIDNWTSLDDPNLYFYLSGRDHDLTVNGQSFKAVWNESTHSFTVTKSGSGGSAGGGGGSGTAPGTITTGDTTVNTGSNGSASLSDNSTVTGETVTVTTAPDKGYKVDQITVTDKDGNPVEVTDNGDGTYSYVKPAGEVTVNVTFKAKEVTVKINETQNGSAAADDDTAEKGDTVTISASPDKWYKVGSATVKDAEGNSVDVKDNGDGTFSFTQPDGIVTVDVTFVRNPDADYPSRKFTDIDINAWYIDAVDYALEKGYYSGTGETTFEPDNTMTRAMFVAVLFRMDGADSSGYTKQVFDDVAAGQWYSSAVEWASENGIVSGIGDGRFDPDGEITREQMAAVMYRYAKYRGIDTSVTDTSVFNTFTDSGTVSDWAKEPMTWAAGTGLINGMGNGRLEPLGNSTRAQVAQVIMNFSTGVLNESDK
jgi:hypothetical protein